MATRNAGLALLRACKQGTLVDVKLLAVPNARETNPPMKIVMGAAALYGHADSLCHLMTSIPKAHWQGSHGPWDPVVIFQLVEGLPREWHVTRMTDYAVKLAAAGGAIDVIQALEEAGLAFDHIVEHSGSPLGIAIIYRKLDLIRFLLARGANPNGSYSFPMISFLNQAALDGSTDIIQLLLDYGAAFQGSKAWQGAAQGGSIKAAELLLKLGVDMNEILRLDLVDVDRDVIGTPLHIAIRHYQAAMVEFLLRHGARQDLLDGHGVTAKELAAGLGNPMIVCLF